MLALVLLLCFFAAYTAFLNIYYIPQLQEKYNKALDQMEKDDKTINILCNNTFILYGFYQQQVVLKQQYAAHLQQDSFPSLTLTHLN